MKNNILSAFVIFFAVVAFLLIIDDISHNNSKVESIEVQTSGDRATSNLATLDLDTEE